MPRNFHELSPTEGKQECISDWKQLVAIISFSLSHTEITGYITTPSNKYILKTLCWVVFKLFAISIIILGKSDPFWPHLTMQTPDPDAWFFFIHSTCLISIYTWIYAYIMHIIYSVFPFQRLKHKRVGIFNLFSDRSQHLEQCLAYSKLSINYVVWMNLNVLWPLNI